MGTVCFTPGGLLGLAGKFLRSLRGATPRREKPGSEAVPQQPCGLKSKRALSRRDRQPHKAPAQGAGGEGGFNGLHDAVVGEELLRHAGIAP